MTENSVSRPMTLGVILYPGFELLDVFGPLEMFTAVGRDRLTTHLIAEHAGPVPAGIVPDGPVGPRVIAEFGFDDAPQLDLLLIPGGIGTFPELANERLMTFLRERSRRAQITASVCTGSALLAKSRRTRRPSRHVEQTVLQPRRLRRATRSIGSPRRVGSTTAPSSRRQASPPAWTWRSRSSSDCSARKPPTASRWAPNTRGIATPTSIRSSRI